MGRTQNPDLETMKRNHFRSATEQTMNAKVSAQGRTKAGKVLKVVGAAAALLVGASAVFAEPHGGGFGGGGGHFSGGAHFSASHGGFIQAAAGAHYAGTAHYAAGGRAYGYSHAYGYGARGGYGVRGGYGYGYRPAWGGGYWHGGFWPAAYYGWSYPLFLGFLPAVYATYWWGGIPYYYVDNVYYTWNAADNGYVAADPPPVSDGGYSGDVNAAAAAGPDAGNAVDNTPPDVAQGQAPGASAPYLGIMAYPRNGQTEQQQSTDKFQCHTWAKGQAGFDPTSQASANASASARSAYGRAMSACLEARGYTVR
jgi:hypothetical protein